MGNSLMKNKKGIMLMIISSVCVCIGQLFWKLYSQYGFIMLLLGFFVYGIGALTMIYAYRFGKLSVLQPVLSLNYVIGTVLSVVILGETINMIKLSGILVIIIGVVIIAGGDRY